MMDKDTVLQAIEKLVKDNGGYDFFNNGGPYPPREREEALYLAVQPKEADERPLLNLVVTIESNRFRVTFDGAKVPEYFKDLNQTLNGIKVWLVNNRGLI